MKSKVLCMLLLCIASFLNGQGDFNLEQVAHVPNSENLSDIWGYVDEDGTEYAIIGTRTKTEVYSLANPASPLLVFSVSGASSVWRDIKVLGKYAYVTADQGTDGVTIIDMTNAPDGITSTKVNPEVNGTPIQACHNLYIDTSIQVMFLTGCNVNDGVIAFDIATDPNNPVLINEISLPYSHDVFVRDGLAFSSEIFGGELAIYDIKDIMNPVLVGSTKTTNFFTHNAWSSEDNQFVFTTDEVSNGTVDAYDISDLSNPTRIDVFVPESIRGLGVVPHNTHWLDNYLITSWYSYGVVIADVSNPSSIVETGHFDTGESPDCWGVYPYLPSGLVIASDISNGLYILQPTYTRASFVAGLVTDADSGAPIFDANVTILATPSFGSRTNPKGEYAAGRLAAGTFTINFNHPEYVSQTTEVTLVAGETVTLDIALVKSEIFMQTISAVDAFNGEALEGVNILIQKEGLDIGETTGEDGSVTGAYVTGDFKIIAGKWGYKYSILDASFSEDGSYTIELERGYQDDFLFDFGWTSETPNARSEWVRVEPIGTSFGGQDSNPGADVEGDLGTLCYVTGNGVGGAGSFDVDDGISILTSPEMDLSLAPGATLRFSPWFFNEGGSGSAPNDTLKVFVSNGTNKALITQYTENTGGWTMSDTFKLADFITLNEQVSISYEAEDQATNGHLVEAGLDAFFVDLSGSVSVDKDVSFEGDWSLSPNPVANIIRLENKAYNDQVTLTIYGIDGKFVSSNVRTGTNIAVNAPTQAGVYFINIKGTTGAEENIKFVKQ